MANHPNRATTYTVLNRHGDVQSEGETLAGAALIVLGYDGHQHEIRAGANGFTLWVSVRGGGGNVPLTKSRIYSLAKDEALATAEIYRDVIRNAEWWDGQSVMTDKDYAAMLAEIAAQEATE